MNAGDLTKLQELINDPVAFLESKFGYYVPELRRPIKHQDWERRLLTAILDASKPVRVIGDIKKNLKTTKAAEIAYYTALKYPNSEVYIVANDFEQSRSRVFTFLVRSLELNPYVKPNITTNQITFSNRSFIKALPSDFRGEAGASPRLTVFDEPWGFVSENSVRMVEEFTPPPNVPDGFQLFTGYAGFEDESKFWLDVYKTGLKGRPVKGFEDLPIYETGEVLMYWSHGPLHGHPGQFWHTREYFWNQENILRPFQFQRLFHNKWVRNEDKFIVEKYYDACLDTKHFPPLPDQKLRLYVGVDASVKRDCTAIVSVYVKDKKLFLGPLEIFHPTPENPIDLEKSVGSYLEWLHKSYKLAVINYDPYQLHSVMTNLKNKGLPVQPYDQTSGNLTAMGSNLFDLFKHGNIVLYEHEELKAHLLNAVAKETPRGYKITKEKAALKIDGAVALAMACQSVELSNAKSTEPVLIRIKRDVFLEAEHFERFGHITPLI